LITRGIARGVVEVPLDKPVLFGQAPGPPLQVISTRRVDFLIFVLYKNNLPCTKNNSSFNAPPICSPKAYGHDASGRFGGGVLTGPIFGHLAPGRIRGPGAP
jgi:hypothetical protein